MPKIILVLVISYLIGSIPTAYIFGRLLKGIDIRKFGSGNVGATNAMRLLGRQAGITVLGLDILKGFLPVVFLANFIPDFNQEVLLVLIGLSCILGHIWTIFLRFKGGKGIATTLGVLIGLSQKVPSLKLVLGITVLLWLVVFILSRIVSLASVMAALSLPILMLVFKQGPIFISSSILLCLLALLRHQANLKRLFQGKEERLNFKKS